MAHFNGAQGKTCRTIHHGRMGNLLWDMSVCHTYYFEYDVRTKAPAHYWEGPNLFPTPIPPPPPPANPPNIFEQCPGLIPFVNCLPGL
jgi:hypothetical protein